MEIKTQEKYNEIKDKLPWPENAANTHMLRTEHWTAVLILLDLVNSAYRDLHH